MILLDTSYLIRALVKSSVESGLIRRWLRDDETLCTSAIVWYEFLCGPVGDEGAELVRSMLQDRVLPFTEDQAVESARLWNLVGRPRAARVDAMIASAAVVSNAALATSNADDFRPFVAFGLRLAPA